MFENIPKEEKENIIIYVMIFVCLLVIGNITYLGFFHYKPDIGLTMIALLFSSPFIITIYKLVKALKK